jgi:hypothetical protein
MSCAPATLVCSDICEWRAWLMLEMFMTAQSGITNWRVPPKNMQMVPWMLTPTARQMVDPKTYRSRAMASQSIIVIPCLYPTKVGGQISSQSVGQTCTMLVQHDRQTISSCPKNTCLRPKNTCLVISHRKLWHFHPPEKLVESPAHTLRQTPAGHGGKTTLVAFSVQ